MAFLGRYTHQDVGPLMDWSMRDVYLLAVATGEILSEETAKLADPSDP